MEEKSWHQRYLEARNTGARIADMIEVFAGSWVFVYIHVVWFGVWILIPVESFPYGFLTMVVSLEAILLATLILMSQNRHSERDRHRAEADYETDVAAKKEIDEIQQRLRRIEDEKLEKILKLLEGEE